ncbi:MAG: GNAT family N-acetyltransferase [Bacillota bacterium]|nr:GNAT family N-acetyltransferase [Bacillota bacterium]
MSDWKIRETKNYEKLVPFFMENELEFTEEDAIETPTDVIKCWEAIDSEDNLIGGMVLAMREEEFICDGIAVDSKWRKSYVGQALLEAGMEEAKGRGAVRMYLVARAPGFFSRNGFVKDSRETAPNFFECSTCPQFNAGCPAEVMRKDF